MTHLKYLPFIHNLSKINQVLLKSIISLVATQPLKTPFPTSYSSFIWLGKFPFQLTALHFQFFHFLQDFSFSKSHGFNFLQSWQLGLSCSSYSNSAQFLPLNKLTLRATIDALTWSCNLQYFNIMYILCFWMEAISWPSVAGYSSFYQGFKYSLYWSIPVIMHHTGKVQIRIHYHYWLVPTSPKLGRCKSMSLGKWRVRSSLGLIKHMFEFNFELEFWDQDWLIYYLIKPHSSTILNQKEHKHSW